MIVRPILWTGPELAAATAGRLRHGFDVTGLSIDTRTLKPGDLFIALVGENSDGHAHVGAALAAGAAGVMVAHTDGLAPDVPALVVEDTLAGLHRLGAAGRARFGGRLVAVTGSVGKTTTKEMLRTILSGQGRTHAAEASYNNHWGVPLTLGRLPADAQWCVSEIGMNHAGEILPLAQLARPDVAVVTTVEAAHIGHLGSLEAIADEKVSIAGGLEPGGVLLLPAGHPLLARMRTKAGDARVMTFGDGPEADAALLDVDGDADGSLVTARIDGHVKTFRLGAPGRHMAGNAVAALAAAAALGADLNAAAASLAGFAAVTGRGARRPILDGRASLLDESYNASAVAVRAALQVLSLVPARRRVVVLGDMLELGEAGPREHLGLAPAVAAVADKVFTCGPLTQGIFEAIPPRLRGAHAVDSAALAPMVAAEISAGDAVLVKGSLGSRMRRVVQALEALHSSSNADGGDTA